MACNTLTEILKGCTSNAGGVSKVYLANADVIDYAGMVITNGQITSVGLTGGTGATEGFVEFQFNPNTSSFTENTTVSLENSSTFYDQAVIIQLARREVAKRQALLAIAAGQPELVAIVKDSNGIYWAFGFGDDKVYLTGNEGGSGTAKTDLNGYTVTLTSQSAVPAYTVSENQIAGLFI